MKFFIYISISITLASCRTYKYNQPTVNPALFKASGEIQISGDIGSSGASIKGAYSLKKQIGIMGMYNSGISDYRAEEGEIGLGYYTNSNPSGIFIVGGLGFGSNSTYTDSTHTNKYWEGDFLKPFIQFNGGITGGTIFGSLKGDLVFSCKATNFIYNGHYIKSGNEIKSNYLLIEPAFVMGLGGKVFQFTFTMGMPIVPTIKRLNETSNARTMPGNASFGLRFFFNRFNTDL